MGILKLKNISKIYGKGESEVKALNGITLEIEKGKFTAVIGKSGSGKSTMLHCMGGLDKPTSGEVILEDLNIYSLNDEKLSKIRRNKYGFVFQNYNLVPVLNVYENIVLPIRIEGRKEDKMYLMKIIKSIGLEEQLNKYPNELSGGQQQRVAIARALANRPLIVFADEPTGNLDSESTKNVMDLFKCMVKDLNQTLVMITHDNEIASHADKVIEISDGKLVDYE